MPGLNRLYYSGEFWPSRLESILDDDLMGWIEQRLWLIPLYPRHNGYNVLDNTAITPENAKRLSDASDKCWSAIQSKDSKVFGEAMKESFEAQIRMYPNMVSEDIFETIDEYKNGALGWKLSGAGGGGYLIFVSETPIKNGIQIRIRRGE